LFDLDVVGSVGRLPLQAMPLLPVSRWAYSLALKMVVCSSETSGCLRTTGVAAQKTNRQELHRLEFGLCSRPIADRNKTSRPRIQMKDLIRKDLVVGALSFMLCYFFDLPRKFSCFYSCCVFSLLLFLIILIVIYFGLLPFC
jgi:hypothetical protein